MRVTIEKIGEEGLELTEDLGQKWLDELLDGERKTGFWSTKAAVLKARFEKVDDGLLVRASSKLPLATECRRCLRQVQLDVPMAFTLSFVPRERLAARAGAAKASDEPLPGGGHEMDPSEIDEETFDGRQVDLDPIVREQLLLSIPMDALCREECAGLCPSCGRDLNEGPCGCAPKPFDPRFQKLRSMKVSN
ncbi:MAG: YceD family protein [Deltaproteobacteria bacterium]